MYEERDISKTLIDVSGGLTTFTPLKKREVHVDHVLFTADLLGLCNIPKASPSRNGQGLDSTSNATHVPQLSS
jgi:hypothetical protein